MVIHLKCKGKQPLETGPQRALEGVSPRTRTRHLLALLAEWLSTQAGEAELLPRLGWAWGEEHLAEK